MSASMSRGNRYDAEDIRPRSERCESPEKEFLKRRI
jgi:hypothetical protein